VEAFDAKVALIGFDEVVDEEFVKGGGDALYDVEGTGFFVREIVEGMGKGGDEGVGMVKAVVDHREALGYSAEPEIAGGPRR
jgi:hypothetical protein